jgi:predicted esterase
MREPTVIAGRSLVVVVAIALLAVVAAAAETRDIRSIEPELEVPPVSDGPPAPGKRVRQTAPDYRGTEVHHLLYLPTDWQPGKRYPVLVEYAGNGPYRNDYGDISTGEVEGSKLGYGISAGKCFLWLCLPYVNVKEKKNQRQWWGDVPATLDYCKQTVRRVCEEYGGDPSAVILLGFSRGSIGCGFLGLHDDEIADLWLAFVPYSHYDGVRRWGYAADDRESARTRLARLKGRASFICHESSVEETRKYIESSGVKAAFTFQALSFHNHNDAWALRDCPERQALRVWLQEVLVARPGTHTVRGRVTDAAGRPLAGVRIETGATHWTETDADGRYELRGLIDGPRQIAARKEGLVLRPARREVTLAGRDVADIDFTE